MKWTLVSRLLTYGRLLLLGLRNDTEILSMISGVKGNKGRLFYHRTAQGCTEKIKVFSCLSLKDRFRAFKKWVTNLFSPERKQKQQKLTSICKKKSAITTSTDAGAHHKHAPASAAVTFTDQSWFPQAASSRTAAAPACCSALYAIGAICSAMNQCLVNFYGSVVTFFILLFFSSTPYWFVGEVKPGGNQEPFMLPHISAGWSNKYRSSMMNCTRFESDCDTTYRLVHDWAHFGVSVWQVVVEDLQGQQMWF